MFYQLLLWIVVFKSSNLFFRYEDSVPVEVCIIDWQFARPSSLATDLACFMYHCTDANLRKESTDELLSVYVDAYTKCLPKETACRFTEEELKIEYRSMKTYIRAYAAMVLPLSLSENFHYPDDATMEEGAEMHAKMIFDVLTKNAKASRRYFDMLLHWGFSKLVKSCYLCI